MLQSNITFYLKGLISPTLWVWQTFNISNDLELWLPVDTDGETVSIVFKNQRQTERMTVTISESVCTIVKRGIEQTGWVASAGLQKEWTEWVTGYITALDFDLLDKDWDTNTVSSNITYSGDNISTWSFDMQWEFKLPVFADTTARDLVYTSPVEWDKCIITGTGEQYYEGWAWNTLWVGTPTPNGSITVAGKFQSATPTERASWDTTWSTWALLIPTNDALVKTPDVTPANDENKIPVLNSSWKVDDFVSDASTTTKGIVEMATDSEASTWTDETRYINAKQAKDNYEIVFPWTDVTYFDSPWIDSIFDTTSYTTLKSYTTTKSGTYRIQYTISASWSSGQWRILIDWLSSLEVWASSGSTESITWDLAIWKWQLVEFQAQNSSGNDTVRISLTTIKWDR